MQRRTKLIILFIALSIATFAFYEYLYRDVLDDYVGRGPVMAGYIQPYLDHLSRHVGPKMMRYSTLPLFEAFVFIRGSAGSPGEEFILDLYYDTKARASLADFRPTQYDLVNEK